MARFKGFRFELYWLAPPGIHEVVKEAWSKPLLATDAVRHKASQNGEGPRS
jgi:hypothetical protein